MEMKLNISAKQLDKKVNYIPFKNTDLFIEDQIKEVKSKNPGQINQIAIYGLTLGAVMIPQTAFASTEVQSQLVNEMISPQVIFDWSIRIGLIGLGGSVGIAIVLLIWTGILKMLKQRQKAKEWTTDIYKGFGHILVTIPTVLALYYLANAIFAQLNLPNMQ